MYDLGVLCEIRYTARENIDTPPDAGRARSRQPRSRQPHRRPFKALGSPKGRESIPRALCATNGSGCIGPGVKH